VSRKSFLLRGLGEGKKLEIEGGEGSWRILEGTRSLKVQSLRLPDGRLSLLLEDGRQLSGRVLQKEAGVALVSTPRGAHRVSLVNPLQDRGSEGGTLSDTRGGNEEIRALMPGRVLEVAVGPGDRVEAGSLLLVLEAMKMQNEIRAETAGVIGQVKVAAGEAVEGGAPLLSIQSVSD
jgi:biotin carboxyl carrier protein